MLQAQFLSALIEARTPVTIFLVNGIRLQGELESYDQYGILFRGHSTQLIYKRAISTIVPSHDVPPAVRHEGEAEAAAPPSKTLRPRKPRSA